MSKRDKIKDSPESKRRAGSKKDKAPADKDKAKPKDDGSPIPAKRLSLKRPSFKRSHASLPKGEAAPKKDPKDKRQRRKSDADSPPIAMKISQFFHIDSPFIKYDEEKQEYERTLSRQGR